MSTLVPLMYRDACNYKTYTDVIFQGSPTPELLERLRAVATADGADDCCIVAEQVGLENPARSDDTFGRRFPDEEDDHGYVEVLIDDVKAVTRLASDGRTFEQFVEECERVAAEGWDPMACITASGGWTDPELAARLRGAPG